MPAAAPLPVRMYLASSTAMSLATQVAWSAFRGLWLGSLSKRSLESLDDAFYVGSKPLSPISYASPDFNRTGLFEWERQLIEDHVRPGSRLLVLAAGGGREVLALRRMGHEADGFECQPRFAEAANRLLEQEGFPATVAASARDTCPPGDARYDGVIIGWAGYMHVIGRRARVAMLEQIRDRLAPEGVLILSFFARRSPRRELRVVHRVANAVRWALRREACELGDFLDPNFCHYFSEEEIREELSDAGLELSVFGMRGYPHAVAQPTQAHEATGAAADASIHSSRESLASAPHVREEHV